MPTLTNLANSTSNGQALAQNQARTMAMFYNDDTVATVKLKLGATASATSFTVAIQPGGYYELPFQQNPLGERTVYQGQVDVIATGATGTLRITEMP